ncbi:MAG: extracellular solute-binding protein, partial [Eubacteriales bacterium]|nr:extracellular solute-binding protein [Eubacteriales bacterium]
HVVCEEYASLSGAGDYAALLDGLDAAILDGSVGDIVELSGRDALVKYSEKNLLTDLYTLMSDDIFGCIREAYEINGRLYGIPQEFRLTTYAAKTQNLNIANIWNTGAFIEHAASLPEGQRMLFNMSRAAVYNMLRDSAISESIDFETNSCSFTAGAFAEFMEYLAGLPETDSEEAEYGMNYYIDDRVALYEAYIGAYSDYARMKHVFGENTEVTSVGYPSSTGGAAKMNAGKLYAITESGTEKEGAVSFLRYLLSPESVINENRGMHDIPAVKTTLKAWNESESKMYYYFYTDNINSMSGDIKPITEEDAGSPGVCVAVDQALTDEVYAYLDSVQIIPAIPQIVADIVDEEMSAYLSSDNKTAEETAKIIQNRVSIYLSEQE